MGRGKARGVQEKGKVREFALVGIPKKMPSSQYAFDEMYLLPVLLGVHGNVVSFVVVYKRNLSPTYIVTRVLQHYRINPSMDPVLLVMVCANAL